MGSEVSKNTVAILLVIVILLSIAGTWVALNVTQTLPGGGSSSLAGEVRIFVQPQPEISPVTGQVALNTLGGG